MKKALFLGILGSFFFAFTFVLNRAMNLSGGFWLWSAALRYLFTLPLIWIVLLRGRQYEPVLADIRKRPGPWLLWSTVGFGLFYAPLSLASIFAESWFTASIWQSTIVAGILLTPVFGQKLPIRNLLLSCLILCGIFVMQIPHIQSSGPQQSLLSPILATAVAAFSYPLGNRMMMRVCQDRFSTPQRVFGMTLCSMPFWLICSVAAIIHAGLPSSGQMVQSLCVAFFSGVLATLLFFRATDLVRNNPRQLAVIEATQSGEVIFTLLLGVLFLHDSAPSPVSLAGIGLIVVGMIANSLATS